MEIKICKNRWCKKEYEVSSDDLAHIKLLGLEKFPDECTSCRHVNRAIFTPGFELHKRNSSLSGKQIFSIYNEDAPFPVYSIEEWYSESWDGKDFGVELDFSKPFFEQYQVLFNRVPKCSNNVLKCDNSDISIHAINSKNVFYSSTVKTSRDVLYSTAITNGDNILDCLRCFDCTYLYSCTLCSECHHSAYLLHCHSVRDSYYCYDLRNCSDCILSSNLRNKKFYYKNEFVGELEFKRIKKDLINGFHSRHLKNMVEWFSLIDNSFRKDQSQVNCENTTGHGLINCLNSYECFHSSNLVNCRYCIHVGATETTDNSMDITTGGIGNNLYSTTSCGSGNLNLKMCAQCRNSSNLTYCNEMINCHDCFGCTGLKNAKFCILNVQYSEKEYRELSQKIIDGLKASDEWGAFFPALLSPFAYNESMASLYFPLTRDDAIGRGYGWRDFIKVAKNNPNQEYLSASSLPDNIFDLKVDITKLGIICDHSDRPYRVLTKELKILFSLNMPVPRTHPAHRAAQRMELLGAAELVEGSCQNCNTDLMYQADYYNNQYLCENCYYSKLD